MKRDMLFFGVGMIVDFIVLEVFIINILKCWRLVYYNLIYFNKISL